MAAFLPFSLAAVGLALAVVVLAHQSAAVVLDDTGGVDAEPRAESADEAVAPTTAGTDAVPSDAEVRIDGDDDAGGWARCRPV